MGRRRRDRGFTIVELLVVIVIIGVITAIAIPNLLTALDRSRIRAMVGNGRALSLAMKSYAIHHDGYPPTTTPSTEALNTATLFPLTRDGYIVSGVSITGQLAGGALTSYGSPGTDVQNLEFYAVLTHFRDSNLVVVVADTNQYPGAMGVPLDGVYVLEDGVLKDPDDAS